MQLNKPYHLHYTNFKSQVHIYSFGLSCFVVSYKKCQAAVLFFTKKSKPFLYKKILGSIQLTDFLEWDFPAS